MQSALDTKEKAIAWEALKNNTIAELTSKGPNFMQAFGSEMQSGDHLRVQAALEDAGERTLAAMQTLGNVDSAGNPSSQDGTLLYTQTVVAAYVAVAVVVVVIAIAFATVKKQSNVATEQTTALYRETLINSIALKLNTAQ